MTLKKCKGHNIKVSFSKGDSRRKKLIQFK